MVHGAMAWLKLGLNRTSGLSFLLFFFLLSRTQALSAESLTQKLYTEIPLGFNLSVNICDSL